MLSSVVMSAQYCLTCGAVNVLSAAIFMALLGIDL